ncbi:helix-turn-helix domain-containing protein [Alteribacter populi]|uniref:helix-turn-helix domain-containing protein n=1 Tax=Alteribacter populi TaxID=2011011 RepID=UPI001FE1D584|nr:helix-turn-helix transcriptional regulator [Alteribacter populi]
MEIGKRIKQKRNEANLKQADLAKKVNVSPQVISNWERGYTHPNHADVSRLSDALNCSTEYLHGKTKKQDYIKEEKDNYDPLEDLKQYMIENNLQDMDFGFYDIEKWKKLSKEDIEEIKRHFDWVVARAEQMEKEDKE